MARRYTWPPRHICVVAIPLLISMAADASAQGSRGQTATQPTSMPLSGRATQAGSVVVTEAPVAGTTTSVNTLNPAVQVQGSFGGSTRGAAGRPFSGTLSLPDALQRGLEYNLGAVNLTQVIKQARGQLAVARSTLLPSVVGDATGTREEVNLAALGVNFALPSGFASPGVVGPFNVVDFRARLTQSVLDLTALNNYRAATSTVRATELTIEDTRDLIVLAVGGTYLQVTTARARVESGRAQLDTANALYQQSADRRAVGLTAQVDVDRSQVQALTQQQRLISLQNDLAKQKINLARMVGLPPTDQYEVGADVSFSAAPALNLEDALRQAREYRADVKAAAAHVEAAEQALVAARAQRLPSVLVNVDYGAIGNTLADARRTFTVVGAVHVPLWDGGRTTGQIMQAEAAVGQRRAEMEDLSAQIEADVRKAYLDLQAATTQVDLANKSRQVAKETLDLTRQRFDAGVSDSVEVIQAQEALANAELDYINSVFAHNVAKLSLARAIGQTAERLPDLLNVR